MTDKPKNRIKMVRPPIVLMIHWKDEGSVPSPPIGPFWSLKDVNAARAELRKTHKPRIKTIQTLQVVKIDTALGWTSE